MTEARTSTVAGGQTRDLTVGSIGRTLFLFSLPVLGSTALTSLNGSVNAVWIGRLLGPAALTATGNANNILFLLLGAVFGLGLATTILVGQAMGRRDLPSAKRAVGTAATFFVFLAIVLAVAGWLGTPYLLHLMATPPEALPLAIDYLRVIFVALPFLYLNAFVGMALRGAGDPRTPFRFLGLGVVLDIGLNPLLIAGLGPFPALGITGSALATLIGQAVALVATLAYLYARKFPLLLRGPDLALLKPDIGLLKTIVAKGVAMGMQMFVVSVSGLTMIGIANRYGVATVAGYAIAMQLWAYVQMPAFALGAASSSMASQNIGAGRWDRVEEVAWKGALIATAMVAALIGLVYLFETPLIRLFLPDDPAALAVAQRVNDFGIWGWLFFAGVMVLFAVVRSTGAVVAPLVILAITLVGVRIPLVLLLDNRMGADAIWFSSPLVLGLTLLLTVLYYRRGGWKKARMGPDDAHRAPEEAGAAPAAAA